MRLRFVVGHEDTPEAYWRVLLPARHFRAVALSIDAPRARETALDADVLWIHQPTGLAAAELAEKARARGLRVVVDLSEDPWLRAECDPAYNEARLEACSRALEAASILVVATEGLRDAFPGAATRVVAPVIPLSGWTPREPETPARLAWWSDGRQRRGFEGVAEAVSRVLDSAPEVRLRHIQFAHLAPLVAALSDPGEKARRAARFSVYLEGDLGAEGNLAMLRGATAGATVALECYPAGDYAASVSDVPLLRAAALGIPSLTTRGTAPPGAVSAGPEEWAEALAELLTDSSRRRELAHDARAWAETRASFETYHHVLQEVLR